nr:hypothetical protein [Rhodophyticola sp. CCM32]
MRSVIVIKAASFLAPYDRIDFPVSDTGSGIDDPGALGDPDAILDLPASVEDTAPFTTPLVNPQMGVERAACTFIGVDVLINAFMAHRGKAFEPHHTVDLFGAPVLTQTSLDNPPLLP